MRGEAATTRRGQRLIILACLAAVMTSFLLFATGLAARLENGLWNAPAFSGWCAAVAHQLVTGKRLYRDVTLPMPPGSFAVLAWIERALGHGARLVYENRVCEVCYALLIPIAYAMARPIAGRRVAFFAAASAAGWASIWAKQLAYDALAEVVAWGALAVMVHAWVREPGARERRWLGAAGFTAGATLIFKQSTATGIVAGGLVGLGYLALVERRTAGALRSRALGALVFAGGSVTGAAFAVVGYGIPGGSMGGFLRAVFVDGLALKGDRLHLVTRAMSGFFVQPTVLWSIAISVLFAAIVFRIVRRGGGLTVGGSDQNAFRLRDAVGVAAAAFVVFGYGAAMLAGWLPKSAVLLVINFTSPQLIAIGFGLAVAFFFGNLGPHADRRGHAFNAAALAALVLCNTVSTSMTYFNPFYENNALMAVVLVGLFAGLERVRLRGLSWAGVVIMMGQPLAWRVPMALTARYPGPSSCCAPPTGKRCWVCCATGIRIPPQSSSSSTSCTPIWATTDVRARTGPAGSTAT